MKKVMMMVVILLMKMAYQAKALSVNKVGLGITKQDDCLCMNKLRWWWWRQGCWGPGKSTQHIWANFSRTGKMVKMWTQASCLKLMTLAMRVMMICGTIISQTSNSSSSGSIWGRTKTKTFLESPGQNLFRTVEKSRKSQTVWSQQSSKT